MNVQLNDARTGRTLWSEQYDRDLTDVLGVQSDVALRVARALHARVSRDERDQVQALPTRDPVAYELFLRARETWAIGANRDALVSTGELVRQAIRRDPDFALAHALLARVHLFLAYQGQESAVDSGLVAVHRALAIDSTIAVAHSSRPWSGSKPAPRSRTPASRSPPSTPSVAKPPPRSTGSISPTRREPRLPRAHDQSPARLATPRAAVPRPHHAHGT